MKGQSRAAHAVLYALARQSFYSFDDHAGNCLACQQILQVPAWQHRGFRLCVEGDRLYDRWTTLETAAAHRVASVLVRAVLRAEGVEPNE